MLWSRPLWTEEAATRGKFVFESGIGLSQRFDEFKTPETEYQTVLIPARIRWGPHDRLDLGFTLRHAAQQLKINGAKFSGSQNAQFSPEFKWRFFDSTSMLFIWHLSQNEKDETLPLARGNDLEIILAHDFPLECPVFLNVGYLLRRDYDSNFGVLNTPRSNVEPGDIFQAKGAFEIPLIYSFSLVTELAYHHVSEGGINGARVVGSSGETLDVLTGINWGWNGWNVGGGVAFGLLDESHTSFAIDRGAGDFMFQFNLSYKLLRSKLVKD